MKNDFIITIGKYNKRKRKYNTIKRLIFQALSKQRDLLPKNLEILLYDYKNLSNNTGLYKKGDRYKIDFNLRELLDFYKNRTTLRRTDIEHLPKFKNFRSYLLFALYHELGHYNLKHHLNGDYYSMYRNLCEIDADKYSLKLLKGDELK